MKKIVLISAGQPSTNPRMVKEANTLSANGFDVYVIYSYWTKWAYEADQQLLQNVKWKAILAGGSPFEGKSIYFFSRARLKLFTFLARKLSLNFGIAERARCRTYPELLKKAKAIKADLYIAHIQGSLPVAVKASKKYSVKCGFDAEDFHRYEIAEDANTFNLEISTFIEDKYLPKVDYTTASSPLIADAYEKLYKQKVEIILNVFPKVATPAIVHNEDKTIKLFWFSQTIGLNRGLETIIKAMAATQIPLQLYLLGMPSAGYKQQITELSRALGILDENLIFYEPISSAQIFEFAAQFDIGLASETGFSLNNNMALSNKLFTYLISGLALVVSDTPAQRELINRYPDAGKIYKDVEELSAIFLAYHQNRELLFQTKIAAHHIGQTQLNWDEESKKFLKIVTQNLETVA